MPKDARDPTADRVAAELVVATEALEREERDYLDRRRGGSSRRLYFPAIVATAQLKVCSFDPQTISLADGMMPPEASFRPVDCVRFTKQLSTQQPDRPLQIPMPRFYGQYGEEARTLAREKERTVFVVNAEKLDNYLREFNLEDRSRR